MSSVAAAFHTLDAAWLDEVLAAENHDGAAVANAWCTSLTFTGATTDMARINIEYADVGRPGPASMIAKLRGRDETRLQLDAVMGLFTREATFYRELGSAVAVRTPRAHYIGDGDDTPLLLEDLGDLRLGDQTEGLGLADAEATVDALADLHAQFWESPAIDAPWLLTTTDGAFSQMVTQMVTHGAPVFAERHGASFGQNTTDRVLEAAHRWGEVLASMAAGPHTLVHNDCRLDNLFFDHDRTPVFVDWQLTARTRGSQDVGNLLAGSMDSADLTAHWRDLIARYHERLVDRGVRNYGIDECVLHYRQNVAWALGQGLAMLGPLSGSDARGVGGRIIERSLAHMGELDTFDALGLF